MYSSYTKPTVYYTTNAVSYMQPFDTGSRRSHSHHGHRDIEILQPRLCTT